MKFTTKNRELYNKLISLNFTDEVIISKQKDMKIGNLLKTFNRKKHTLDIKTFGNKILLKKVAPFDVEIYFLNSKLK